MSIGDIYRLLCTIASRPDLAPVIIPLVLLIGVAAIIAIRRLRSA